MMDHFAFVPEQRPDLRLRATRAVLSGAQGELCRVDVVGDDMLLLVAGEPTLASTDPELILAALLAGCGDSPASLRGQVLELDRFYQAYIEARCASEGTELDAYLRSLRPASHREHALPQIKFVLVPGSRTH